MPRRKARKITKQPTSSNTNDDKNEQEDVLLDKQDEPFRDPEVERQLAAITALRDMEIEQFRTMLRLIRSNLTKEQLKMPVLEFFKEYLPNVSIVETGKDGQIEVKWKDADEENMSLDEGRALHNSFLRRLSMAYPQYSAGIASMGGFEFSNKSVKTGYFGADKLQISSLVLEEPSDSQIIEQGDGLRTPNVNSNRLSVGMTPKTRRLPKYGEMLVSVRGSPLGVYKEDNMETIQESEDA